MTEDKFPILHPDKYGKTIEHGAVTHGVHQEPRSDNRFVKCKKCGYTLDRTRHQKGHGEGNTWTTATSFSRGSETLYNGADTDTVQGCPFCGTFNFER